MLSSPLRLPYFSSNLDFVAGSKRRKRPLLPNAGMNTFRRGSLQNGRQLLLLRQCPKSFPGVSRQLQSPHSSLPWRTTSHRRGARTAAKGKAKEKDPSEELEESMESIAEEPKTKKSRKAKPKQEVKELVNGNVTPDKKKVKHHKPFPTFPGATAFDKLPQPHSIFIDNSFLVHRAYHSVGLVGLKDTKGTPLGAVFGYTRAMLKLFSDMKADYVGTQLPPGHNFAHFLAHLAVFCDTGKSFRHEAFPEYKAQRSKTPSVRCEHN